MVCINACHKEIILFILFPIFSYCKIHFLVLIPTISPYMPVVLAMMTLNAIFCVTFLIGLPVPIISYSASSISSTSTTVESSSSSTPTLLTTIFSIFSC